jgi:hypothetical protein
MAFGTRNLIDNFKASLDGHRLNFQKASDISLSSWLLANITVQNERGGLVGRPVTTFWVWIKMS